MSTTPNAMHDLTGKPKGRFPRWLLLVLPLAVILWLAGCGAMIGLLLSPDDSAAPAPVATPSSSEPSIAPTSSEPSIAPTTPTPTPDPTTATPSPDPSPTTAKPKAQPKATRSRCCWSR
jgi:hypothetical protein